MHRKKKDYERGKEEAVMLGGGGGLDPTKTTTN